MDDQLFQLIKTDIDEMKKDIKTLLAFKWQIISGSVVISAIVGVVIQIAIAWIGRG